MKVIGYREWLSLADLAPHTIEMMILRILETTPLHGYALASVLRDRSGGRLEVDNDALYPSLMRLSHSGCLDSIWSETVTKRKRRIYSVTRQGRAKLQAAMEKNKQMEDVVRGVLDD